MDGDQAFAKLKVPRRTAGRRTVDALGCAIGHALDASSPAEFIRDLADAGYVLPDREPH